jgi:hypothetical protein
MAVFVILTFGTVLTWRRALRRIFVKIRDGEFSKAGIVVYAIVATAHRVVPLSMTFLWCRFVRIERFTRPDVLIASVIGADFARPTRIPG